MMSFDEARNKGLMRCTDMLGYDFCVAHSDNSVSSYGENEGIMSCFVGISDKPVPADKKIILTSGNDWDYWASCKIDMLDGNVIDEKCVSPAQ